MGNAGTRELMHSNGGGVRAVCLVEILETINVHGGEADHFGESNDFTLIDNWAAANREHEAAKRELVVVHEVCA